MLLLTKEFRRIAFRAREASKRFESSFPGTDHFLLALAAEPEGVAARALASLDVDYPRMLQGIVAYRERHPERISAAATLYMEECEQRVHATFEAARELGDSYIDSEHVLLALLSMPECIAVDALVEMGIAPDKLRRVTLDLVARLPPHPFQKLETYQDYPQIKPLLELIEQTQAAKDEATIRADFERVLVLLAQQDELYSKLQDTLGHLAEAETI
jgi:ATP-dependent Clp protease ATP-binding subunit ClpA